MSVDPVNLPAPESQINKDQADYLDSVNKRIELACGDSVVLGSTAFDGKGFAARYEAKEIPPVLKKAQFLEGMTIRGGRIAKPQVVLPVSDRDVEIMENKRKMNEQLQFDRWITKQWDPFGSPVNRQWMQNIYPEYFEARLRQNEAVYSLKAQYDRILLTGPKTKEDLYLMWKIDNDGKLREAIAQPAGLREKDKDPQGEYSDHHETVRIKERPGYDFTTEGFERNALNKEGKLKIPETYTGSMLRQHLDASNYIARAGRLQKEQEEKVEEYMRQQEEEKNNKPSSKKSWVGNLYDWLTGGGNSEGGSAPNLDPEEYNEYDVPGYV